MPKTRTNISLDSAMFEEARKLGMNISAITENALQQELRRERARQWHEENAEALEARTRWIEQNGMPLAQWQVLKAD